MTQPNALDIPCFPNPFRIGKLDARGSRGPVAMRPIAGRAEEAAWRRRLAKARSTPALRITLNRTTASGCLNKSDPHPLTQGTSHATHGGKPHILGMVFQS